jgi:hypothetical protein
MTDKERIAQLEMRLTLLEGRLAKIETKDIVYGPIPAYPPVPTIPDWCYPFTLTCTSASELQIKDKS